MDQRDIDQAMEKLAEFHQAEDAKLDPLGRKPF